MGEGKGGRRGTDPSTPEGRRNPWCLSTAAQPTPDRPSMPMQPSARPQVPRRPLSRLGVSAPPCVAPSLGDTCRVGLTAGPSSTREPSPGRRGAFVSSRGLLDGGVRNGQRRVREVWDGVFHTPDGWARSAAVRTCPKSSLGEISNHKFGYSTDCTVLSTAWGTVQ